jgi:methylated-DNA-[protein]-cysteine S-methyltransferase
MAMVRMESAVGVIEIFASGLGVTRVDFTDVWADENRRGAVMDSGDDGDVAMAHARQAERELREYFDGERREFCVALDVTGTTFQKRCWAYLSTIPYAQTRAYVDQAVALGDAKGTRAVGAANGKNPVSIIVPCHRVVARSGGLQGFAGGLHRKRWLLDHEAMKAGVVLVG